jgi:hypothetical protein
MVGRLGSVTRRQSRRHRHPGAADNVRREKKTTW